MSYKIKTKAKINDLRLNIYSESADYEFWHDCTIKSMQFEQEIAKSLNQTAKKVRQK
jgi:hypothetical protein